MAFKDSLKDDLDIFFDMDEFAETILFNGKEIIGIFELKESQKFAAKGEGFYKNPRTNLQPEKYILKTKMDSIPSPKVGQRVTIGKEPFFVEKVGSEMGMLTLDLSKTG